LYDLVLFFVYGGNYGREGKKVFIFFGTDEWASYAKLFATGKPFRSILI
jgi:hypothetical protein